MRVKDETPRKKYNLSNITHTVAVKQNRLIKQICNGYYMSVKKCSKVVPSNG